MRLNKSVAFGIIATTVGASAAIALLIINRIIWFIGISTVADDAQNAASGIVKLLLVIASWPWWALAMIAALALIFQFWHAYRVASFIEEAKTYTDRISRIEENLEKTLTVFDEHKRFAEERILIFESKFQDRLLRLYEAMIFRETYNDLKKVAGSLKLIDGDTAPPQGWAAWLCEQAILHDKVHDACNDKLTGNWRKALLVMTHEPWIANLSEQNRLAYTQLKDDEITLDLAMREMEQKMRVI